MFLTSPECTLEVSFRVSYMVYASNESLKCFECGDLGHKRFSCPHKVLNDSRPSTSHMDILNSALQTKEKRRKGPEQVDGAAEIKGKNEVSNLGKVTMSNEKPGCSSGNTESVFREPLSNEQLGCSSVTGGIENGLNAVVDVTSGDEEMCVSSGAATAGGSEDGLADELDSLSQKTDDSIKDDEQWSDFTDMAGEYEKDLYSVEEINSFLDKTKGKAGVEVHNIFLDLDKFVSSVMWARKVSSYKEISQQKRFRLKKHITAIRQSGKSTQKERLTRGKTK